MSNTFEEGRLAGWKYGVRLDATRDRILVELTGADDALLRLAVTPSGKSPAFVRTPRGDVSYLNGSTVPDGEAAELARDFAARLAKGEVVLEPTPAGDIPPVAPPPSPATAPPPTPPTTRSVPRSERHLRESVSSDTPDSPDSLDNPDSPERAPRHGADSKPNGSTASWATLDAGIVKLSKDRYLSRYFAERERERLWPAVWLHAAPRDLVREPGQYVTVELGGTDILVVRGRDNQVRAFHNVCPHRGSRLMPESCGKAKALLCPLHNWQWHLDGRLANVPRREVFGEQADEAFQLFDIACEEWGGQVWVHLGKPEQSLEEWLRPVSESLANYDLDKHVLVEALTYDLACNWKTAMDLSSESYHLDAVHPYLLDLINGDEIRFEAHGLHWLKTLPLGRPSSRTRDSGIRGHFAEFLESKGVDVHSLEGDVSRVPEALRRALRERGFNKMTDEELVVYRDWFVFPSVNLNLSAGELMMHRYRPHRDDPERMWYDQFKFQILRPGEERPAIKQVFIDEVESSTENPYTEDDLRQAVNVQRGMRSAGFQHSLLGGLESYLARTHANIDQFLARPNAPSQPATSDRSKPETVSSTSMKRVKLPGFGKLGFQIVDVNLATASDDEIRLLGEHHMHDLVTVIRKEHVGGITPERFHAICTSWSIPTEQGNFEQTLIPNELTRKYGPDWWERSDELEPADREVVEEMKRCAQGVEHLRGMVRITGKRDERGRNTGMFSEGVLEWHSNQQGTTYFAPGAALLAVQGTGGSRTDFLNMVDAYEALPSDWRTLCDELVAVHHWKQGEMAPGVQPLQERVLQLHMVPMDGTEVPLVTTSPAGHRGLHFAFTSIHHFKGMSVEESQKIIDELKKLTVRPEYIYEHTWQDGDVVLFDNTVTLHRRPFPDTSKRLLYRISFNLDRLLASRRGVAETG